MKSVRRIARFAFVVACLAGLPARATAQRVPPQRWISVNGTGEVLARPSQVEIDISAGGLAELTADANQKYLDALRRTTDAFTRLEMEDLKIEERELSFTDTAGGNNAARGFVVANGRVAARGAGLPDAKPEVGISRSLRLVLGNIRQRDEAALRETISTLIDTARDVGATVHKNSPNGSMSLVTFVVDDADQQREQAYQKAFDAARSRASKLAALAGSTLGPVSSINEQQNQVYSPRLVYPGRNSDGDTRLMSDTLGDIPVRVTLHVQFVMGPQDDGGDDDDDEDDAPADEKVAK